jgi:hypothetical protein
MLEQPSQTVSVISFESFNQECLWRVLQDIVFEKCEKSKNIDSIPLEYREAKLQLIGLQLDRAIVYYEQLQQINSAKLQKLKHQLILAQQQTWTTIETKITRDYPDSRVHSEIILELKKHIRVDFEVEHFFKPMYKSIRTSLLTIAQQCKTKHLEHHPPNFSSHILFAIENLFYFEIIPFLYFLEDYTESNFYIPQNIIFKNIPYDTSVSDPMHIICKLYQNEFSENYSDLLHPN